VRFVRRRKRGNGPVRVGIEPSVAENWKRQKHRVKGAPGIGGYEQVERGGGGESETGKRRCRQGGAEKEFIINPIFISYDLTAELLKMELIAGKVTGRQKNGECDSSARKG